MTADPELKSLAELVLKMHDEMFALCLSNPVFNSWGKKVDMTNLNAAYVMADKILRRLKS